jgi:hypothetical protein
MPGELRPYPTTADQLARDAKLRGRTISPSTYNTTDERHPLSGIPTITQLMRRFQEMGMLPNTEGADLIPGGVNEAVTAFLPKLLPEVRASGRTMIDKIAEKGLEQRALGIRPRRPESMGKPLSQTTEADYKNTPLNDDQIEVLRIAQQRWPRLFGHVREMTEVDALSQLKTMFGTLGTSGPKNAKLLTPAEQAGIIKPDSLSRIGFDPSVMSRVGKDQAIDEFAKTVGHELLHSKDRLTMGNPKMIQGYQHAEGVVGYKNNPYEVRARNMGDRFKKIVEETKKAGGNRSFLGKNVRVPLEK